MISLKKYKEKFGFYWGQKKYKLSLWGVSPHFDWNITRLIIGFLFVCVCAWGYMAYTRIDTLIHADPAPTFSKKTRINIPEMQKFTETLTAREAEFNAILR